MNNYTDTLRKHNLKATPQRLAIADTLNIYGHIDIESLYEIMLKKFSSISLATIYKNINLMLENSFIQEIKIPHAKAVYELTKSSHSHLACNRCGKVYDININLDTIVQNASKLTQFKIDTTNLVLSGICKNCQ